MGCKYKADEFPLTDEFLVLVCTNPVVKKEFENELENPYPWKGKDGRYFDLVEKDGTPKAVGILLTSGTCLICKHYT